VSKWNLANDWFYYDSTENALHCRYSFVGNYEVAAWGSGESGGGQGEQTPVINIIDNLTSSSTGAALSANQGRILKDLIDNIEVTGEGAHTHANLNVLNGITDSSVNAWNNAATNSHTHSNKSVLDGITSAKVTKWDGYSTTISNVSTRLNNVSTRLSETQTDVEDISTRLNNVSTGLYNVSVGLSNVSTGLANVSTGLANTSTRLNNVSTRLNNVSTRLNNVSTRLSVLEWLDDAFYFDDSDNTVHVNYSFVGDYEVAAWGTGSDSGEVTPVSNITVIDNLTSTSTGAALSANQGRVLKDLIDSIEITGESAHTHPNIEILNGINNTSISNWNTAYSRNHQHSNKTTLDKLTSTAFNNFVDASNLRHEHDNLDIVDSINNTSISNWNTAYSRNH